MTISFLLFLLVVGVVRSEKIVFTNETLGICNYDATCSVSGYEGVCVSISSGCCSSGTVTSGLCPGSDDIKCCTQASCATPSGSGTCMQTSLCTSQGGSPVSGYCSGPADVQCCVKKNPSCSYEATCSVGGYEGACVAISEGCCSGVVTSGLCPGSSDIKCCTQSTCSTPSGTGACMQTSLCSSQGGTSIPGYCVGPSDLQCCVQSGGNTGLGIDVSTTITSSAASCLKSSGISFIVPRGYMQVCSPDNSVCPSLINAANAGIENRDVYLYPCISKSGDQQMGELINYLNSNCKSYWSGRVWLDIEGASGWFGSYSTNQQFYKELVDACSHYGIRCGVYSSASQWQGIFGSTSFTYGADLPLWYAHWDYAASFSDFTAFGGWNAPHAKQYVGDTSLCGMGVDRDYAPSF